MEIIAASPKLVYSSTWMGYPLLSHYAPFYENYLYKNIGVIENACRQYPKVLAIRFDLRMPPGFPEADTAVISRFMASLNSQIHEDHARHARQGNYLHGCRLRYAWAREYGGNNERLHYHVCILLNYKRYSAIGRYVHGNEIDSADAQRNMAHRICKAWMSATYGMATPALVHFCENGAYILDRNSHEFMQQKADLFCRLSYLAKTYTKEMVNGRKFGCSRG